jgi:hypothetical protein
LEEELPKFLRSVALDEPAHALALSPRGEVLAVAYDGGVEVSSLAENALPTDKRAVKSDRVDSLSFSEDGTMLLGTTQNSKNASTVIISAPYFTETAEDMPHGELISHMWTSQILFPYSSRDCSHAALLPRKMDHDANWTLTYDRVFESFRAVRTDDLRNGTTYFAGPKPSRESERQRLKSTLTPCTLPATTKNGELVAAGFLGSEIWLYGVPEDLDNHTITANGSPVDDEHNNIGNVSALEHDSSRQEIDGLPRWQVLVDKYRNVFAKGRRIATVSNVSQLCWTWRPNGEKGLENIRERLVIGAPGGVSIGDELEQEEMASLDGGRLVVLDFNWSPEGGKTKEIVVEVGIAKPQKLEEENTDMATEIAIVRRRTVGRRDGIPRSQVASVADVLRPADEPIPPVPALPTAIGFGLDSNPTAVAPPEEPTTPVSPTDGITLEEAAETFDGPYSHTDPRSSNTLYRSATAVEASRRRAPQVPSSGVVEYRRTDGTELPHESDADNWVPPPPPYTKDPDEPLPEHLRQTLMPRNTPSPSPALGATLRRPLRALSTIDQMGFRRRSSADVDISSHHTTSSRQSLYATVAEQGPILERNADTVSPVSGSQSQSTSPVSARNMSPLASMRRPLSNYESRSNRSSVYRAALRPASPIGPVEESSAATVTPARTHIPAPRPIRISRSPSLTLSGTNLQQRLDYPLPPAPPKDNSPVETNTPRSRPSPTNRPTASAALTPPPPVAPSATSVSAVSMPLEPVPEPTTHQLNNLRNRTSPSSPEPSAYASNASRLTTLQPPAAAQGAVTKEKQSRFRSPFRRNTERIPSNPHLRSFSAMNLSTHTLPHRPSLNRLDTIYSVGTQATVSRTQSRITSHPENRIDTRPATATATATATSTRPVSRATTVTSKRLTRRMSRLRGRSEDPDQFSLAAQHATTQPNLSTPYVGRGRRRARGENEADAWENMYPAESYGYAVTTNVIPGDETKKRKGGGKCIIM